MSDSAVSPPSGVPTASERPARLAALALAVAAFALVVPQILAQDLPWWDEATYLGVGRGLVAGAPANFAWSPGYALTLGIARAVLGPVRAIPVAHVLWSAVFAVAVGLCVHALLRDVRPALALAAAALGTSHALVTIGPQRAAISLVLLAFAALASRRWRRVGLVAGAALALAAPTCRLEAAFALPFLPPAAWAASPSAAPHRAARMGWVAAFSVAAIAFTLGPATANQRAWFAFSQHYAFDAYAHTPRAFPPGFMPALQYAELVGRDFPGAHSVAGAARVAPVRFGLHVARSAATAVEMAAAALTPERFGGSEGAMSRTAKVHVLPVAELLTLCLLLLTDRLRVLTLGSVAVAPAMASPSIPVRPIGSPSLPHRISLPAAVDPGRAPRILQPAPRTPLPPAIDV